VDAVGLQHGMVVAHVTFVIHFDQHVGVALVEQPTHRVFQRAPDRGRVAETLVLAKVENADDRDHA
jgi:hypothetical protein